MPQINITHVIVHTPEQAREILTEAALIADEAGGDGLRWESTFREACRLLGARHTIALAPDPMPINLPAMAIPRGRH